MKMMQDDGLFLSAVENAVNSDSERLGIGTYKEKTLHTVLKNYFEPDKTKQEIPVGAYIADIKNENGITEIQTSSLVPIRKRLEAFLRDYPVTVVHPIAGIKYIVWIDPETGAVTNRRKSPKKGSAVQILPEIFYVTEHIPNENFRIKCVLLELTEYRVADGWGNGGKRGSHRKDTVPSRLIEIRDITSESDVRSLVPISDGVEFTVKEFAEKCGFSPKSRKTNMALKALRNLKLASPCGKKGRAILYKMNSPDDEYE